MRSKITFIVGGLAAAWLAGTSPAMAQKLTLYCSPQIEWCNLMVEAFEKETGNVPASHAADRSPDDLSVSEVRTAQKFPPGANVTDLLHFRDR